MQYINDPYLSLQRKAHPSMHLENQFYQSSSKVLQLEPGSDNDLMKGVSIGIKNTINAIKDIFSKLKK